MKNRYWFFTKMFADYGIFFLKNNKYYTLGMDKIMLNYLPKINYVVINENNDITVVKQKHNAYREIYLKESLKEVLAAKIKKYW